MADDPKSANTSGLSNAEVDSRLAALKSDWRIQECVAAIAASKRADVGFFVQSKQQFFDTGGKPVVTNCEPALVRDLADPSGKPLTAKDAAIKQSSSGGFVAGLSVDLGKVGDIEAYLRNLLVQFGPIELAPRFSPTLTRSLPFIAADRASQQKVSPGTVYDGRDTTVCVIDMGCDFAHRNFRTTDELMTSRLKFLTVMNTSSSFTKHPTGTINTWLTSATPYATYDPHNAFYNCLPVGADDGTHGTMVLDIAAGNGGGTTMVGVAPKADLCFVQVFVNETYGRRYISGDTIYNAISHALAELGSTMPIVVSVSLGTNDGPHDSENYGGSIWNGLLDALFDSTNNARALVWSAGNQGLTDAHLTGNFKTGGANAATFDIRIPKGDAHGSEFKVWFDKPASVTPIVKVRLEEYAGNSTPGTWQTTASFNDEGARVAGTFGAATKYGSSAAKSLHYIHFTLTPYARRSGAPAAPDRWETWRFELSTTTSATDIAFHAWIDHDARDGVRFLPGKPAFRTEIDPNCSLSAAAAGLANATIVGAITPGGYQPGKPIYGPGQGDAISFSSFGPTRTNLQRPDVSAPGDAIRGARSKGDPVGSKTGYGPVGLIAMTGTSMAAPHVAGLVALYFDKLKRANTTFPANFPTSDGMRKKLREAARPPQAGGTASWEAQRGCGCVDASILLK